MKFINGQEGQGGGNREGFFGKTENTSYLHKYNTHQISLKLALLQGTRPKMYV